MIFASYCYEESKTSDDEDYFHVDRVEKKDDTKIVDLLNQFM